MSYIFFNSILCSKLVVENIVIILFIINGILINTVILLNVHYNLKIMKL